MGPATTATPARISTGTITATVTLTPTSVTSTGMALVTIEPHPLLEADHFETRFPRALGEMTSSVLTAPPALQRSEAVRLDVRDMLRHGGYKPTGRGKPASEYLVKIAEKGLLSTNLAVDACNVVSLHSGLPISVVDLDRTSGELRIGIVEGDQRYVFNASGQEIRLEGLLCLFDREGPCANGVKDSERTKTHDDTRRTLSLIWGPKTHPEHVARAGEWYRALLREAGAEVDG